MEKCNLLQKICEKNVTPINVLTNSETNTEKGYKDSKRSKNGITFIHLPLLCPFLVLRKTEGNKALCIKTQLRS